VIKRVALWLFIVDAIVVSILLIVGQFAVLQNFEIGFVSAVLVLSASMLSYGRMVKKRIETYSPEEFDERDVIDKLDDPHALFGEKDEINTKDIKEVIKTEKRLAGQNKRSLSQTLKDSKASFSIFRIGAYLTLFAGFLYLNKNHLLHIPSYMIGLTIPIVVVIILLMAGRGEQ